MSDPFDPSVRCACCNTLMSDPTEAMGEERIYDDFGELDYIELFCGDCAEADMIASQDFDEPHPDPCDAWDDADTLTSIGWGTDEDYGYYGGDEDF